MPSHFPVQHLGNPLPCSNLPRRLAAIPVEYDAAQMWQRHKWQPEVTRFEIETGKIRISASLSWQRRWSSLPAGFSSVTFQKRPVTRKSKRRRPHLSSTRRKFIRRLTGPRLILASTISLLYHLHPFLDALVKSKQIDVITSIRKPFEIFLSKCDFMAPYHIRTGHNLTENEDQVELIIRMAQLLCPEDRSSRWLQWTLFLTLFDTLQLRYAYLVDGANLRNRQLRDRRSQRRQPLPVAYPCRRRASDAYCDWDRGILSHPPGAGEICRLGWTGCKRAAWNP